MPLIASVAVVILIVLVGLSLRATSRDGHSATPGQRVGPAHAGVWVGSPHGVVPPAHLVPGEFWYVRTLVDEPDILPLRAGHAPPVVRYHQEVIFERWIGRAGQVSRSVTTAVGPMRFDSAADRARWRAAGSPASALQSGPQVGFSFGGRGFGALAEFSYQDLQRLPIDPVPLLEQLKTRLSATRARQNREPQVVAAQVARAVAALLEAPAPRRVHTALVAVARELAGAHARSGADPIGRQGIVLPLGGPGDTVIIDATSGALLADSTFGGLGTYIAAAVVRSPTAVPAGFPPIRPVG